MEYMSFWCFFIASHFSPFSFSWNLSPELRFEDHQLQCKNCHTNQMYINPHQDVLISYCKHQELGDESGSVGSINFSNILTGKLLAKIHDSAFPISANSKTLHSTLMLPSWTPQNFESSPFDRSPSSPLSDTFASPATASYPLSTLPRFSELTPRSEIQTTFSAPSDVAVCSFISPSRSLSPASFPQSAHQRISPADSTHLGTPNPTFAYDGVSSEISPLPTFSTQPYTSRFHDLQYFGTPFNFENMHLLPSTAQDEFQTRWSISPTSPSFRAHAEDSVQGVDLPSTDNNDAAETLSEHRSKNSTENCRGHRFGVVHTVAEQQEMKTHALENLTALCFNENRGELYTGDTRGQIYVWAT